MPAKKFELVLAWPARKSRQKSPRPHDNTCDHGDQHASGHGKADGHGEDLQRQGKDRLPWLVKESRRSPERIDDEKEYEECR